MRTPGQLSSCASGGPALVLDVRPAHEFERLHRRGAVNIPLAELADRAYELPPRDAPLTVYHSEETLARWARSRLRARERRVAIVAFGNAWLQSGPTEFGPTRGRLWQPHSLLQEAVGLAAGSGVRLQEQRALDIACGSGRDAVYLALCGFEVEAWDILPDACSRAEELARRSSVSIATVCRDVECDMAIPPDQFDWICCFNFLHRPLMPILANAVRPGGWVVYETFVSPQRELFGKPARRAHVLKTGELPGWFDGWELAVSREGLTGPRRFAASIVARKPL